jgi:hypothetical protein
MTALTSQVGREIRSVTQDEPLARRTLKIEADGDPWKGNVIPKIRLMGRWLDKAGFKPGSRVQITHIAAGVIELRSDDPSLLGEQAPRSTGQPQ